MLKGKRNDKLALEIRHVVAEALVLKAKDPRIGFVTVTEAELSPDLKHATIYISVMGEEKQKKSTLIALNYAKGFFQKEVADKLNLKYTPKIRFHIDNSIEQGNRIDNILKEINNENDPEEE